MRPVMSWGRVSAAMQDVREPAFADGIAGHLDPGAPAAVFGMGRSYGDLCLNDGGRLIATRRLDRMISADWERGILRAEAGISLDAILRLAVPRGWFLPVTPGTKHVTLGGAIASDVHGKNHETAGTFGSHVRALALRRSSGETIETGPALRPDLFAATVGGLGLTGVIVSAEIALAPIRSAFFDTETIRLRDLDHFFAVAEESRSWPYTVAWVDCFATGARLGSGLFTRARFAGDGGLAVHRTEGGPAVPAAAPSFMLGSTAVRGFNRVYANRPGATGTRRLHYDRFLYPLDRIGGWNRLYGRAGFYQHQSAVPMAAALAALRRLLEATAAARQGSFLVVLKLFGGRASPGLLSFPMEGATFALDLQNRGDPTRALLATMNRIAIEAGGRLYPAKDATMTPAEFRAGYPRWRAVEALRDPAILSDFWRRVTGEAA